MKRLPSFSALVAAYPNQAQPSDVFAVIGGRPLLTAAARTADGPAPPLSPVAAAA